MLARIFLLLTLVPLAELVVLVTVHDALADRFGGRNALMVTIGSIIVTGFVGAALARIQGVAAVRELRGKLSRGEFPGRELLDAALIVAGGALLLLPGYLSDALGLTLLIPPTRALYRRVFERWLQAKVDRGQTGTWTRVGPRGPSPSTSAYHTVEGGVVIEETFTPGPENGPRGDANPPPSGSP